MRELSSKEIKDVNGGCAKYCWGDASMDEFVGAVSSGARFGWKGALAGGIAYGFKVMWF